MTLMMGKYLNILEPAGDTWPATQKGKESN